MRHRIFFSLAGVKHSLKDGDIVAGIDHGGSGADSFVGIYDSSVNGIWVIYRRKFGPEFAPIQVLRCLHEESERAPTRIVYGVAAPAKNNRAPAAGNMPYAVDGNRLSKRFPSCPVLWVCNDYRLVTEGFKVPIDPRSVCVLQRGKRGVHRHVITAAGSGTGLGTGRLTFLEGGGYLTDQLEGSHGPLVIRYDPGSPINQLKLLPWWSKRYGHRPNSEKVICAGGLLKLLEFVVDTHGYTLSAELSPLMQDPNAAHQARLRLAQLAMDGSDNACTATLGLFMDLLGGFTQNAAFLHGPRENNYRIYLLGGVLAGLLKHEQFLPRFAGHFLKSFCDTPEPIDQEWLAGVPIAFLKDHRLHALHGAAVAAACLQI